MTNVKLIIQFDGTDFCGWQVQKEVRTAQGVLGAALQKMTGCRVTLHSSSRTDSGVHALAMPVSFRIGKSLPMRAFERGLNTLLPPDIRVISASRADPSFNARFSAGSKTYRYRVLNHHAALPLQRRTAWHVPSRLDIDAMRDAAGFLWGEHDFTAFRSVHCDALSPVRTIDRLSIEREGDNIILIEVEAMGFLRNMVRIIVGTLVQVGLGRHQPAWVDEVLKSRDRTAGGPTAPPQGLFLVGVEYRD
ncbi:MAG: tRNA pseudouridine(38-40) synthase TruA [Deltaproteobacteria bacterium]|nr:tRNA pseudouridine(38-40) synthase TruA [Deltaproteobacteria bacterium]